MVNKEKKSILKTIEDYLIVLLLSLVILVSLTQIGMRLFFNSSIIWGDEFIKIIILWLAMIASVSASRSNRHLKIDLIDNFISNKISHFPKIISKLFVSIVCGVVTWHSILYIHLTITFDETVLNGFPAWIAYAIVPLSFFMMSCRYFVQALNHIVKINEERHK